MDNTKTLETERLILRKFTMDDAEGAYNNWCTDLKANNNILERLHKSVDETKELISKYLDKYKEGSYIWIVELKDTHEVIGSILEESKSIKNRTISFAYGYGSKYWNKNYATEALRRVIEYILSEQDFYLVEASHRLSNPASGRVMQKAGMKYDGTLRERRINSDGSRDDIIYYSITKNEL